MLLFSSCSCYLVLLGARCDNVIQGRIVDQASTNSASSPQTGRSFRKILLRLLKVQGPGAGPEVFLDL